MAGGVATVMLPKPIFSMPEAKKLRMGKLVKGRKINIAAIGSGGRGRVDTGQTASENIIALCDVDFERAKPTFDRFPDARRFRDYREMLVEMDDEIDAVTISTPDHMHFHPAMMAIEMGKHVLLQKPLTHTVREARLLTEAARRHGVVTQMANQGHSNEGTRLVREWIAADAIGDVHEVHIWTNRPIWPQNIPMPVEHMEPPATFDWNRWLGVAPFRPFNEAFAPFKWRGWWEWGCGAIGDMGCHSMDASFWALDLGAPERISAKVDGGNEFSCPAGAEVTYEFPARGSMPPVVVKWYEGTLKNPPRPRELEPEREMPRAGQVFYGSKGAILAAGDYCESPRLIPETAMRAFARPPRTLERVPEGHHGNWLRGIRGEIENPVSHFDYAGPLTEMALLGNVAIRSGVAFRWDARNLRCDRPEAQAFIDKTYRVF
jgi:predicted dehydrogenase